MKETAEDPSAFFKKISYTRAKELGIRMARLPIDEYMVKRPNPKNFHSKILAINQGKHVLWLTFSMLQS